MAPTKSTMSQTLVTPGGNGQCRRTLAPPFEMFTTSQRKLLFPVVNSAFQDTERRASADCGALNDPLRRRTLFLGGCITPTEYDGVRLGQVVITVNGRANVNGRHFRGTMDPPPEPLQTATEAAAKARTMIDGRHECHAAPRIS